MVLPSNTCRLCAELVNYSIPIFEEAGRKNNLPHKLRICSPVTVRETDTLPTQVCLDCLSNLDQVYEFYQKSKNAQLTLAAMIKLDTSGKRCFSDSNDDPEAKRKRVGTTYFTFSNVENVTKEESSDGSKSTDGSKCSDGITSSDGSKSSISSKSSDPVKSSDAGKSSDPVKSSDAGKSSDPVKSSDAGKNSDPIKSSDAGKSSDSGKISVAGKSVDASSDKQGSDCTNSKQNSKPLKKEPPSPLPPQDSNSQTNIKKNKTISVADKLLTQETTSVKVLNSSSESLLKECRYCKQEFQEDKLHQHEILHYGKAVYECFSCEKAFTHKEAFERHCARHTRQESLPTNGNSANSTSAQLPSKTPNKMST